MNYPPLTIRQHHSLLLELHFSDVIAPCLSSELHEKNHLRSPVTNQSTSDDIVSPSPCPSSFGFESARLAGHGLSYHISAIRRAINITSSHLRILYHLPSSLPVTHYTTLLGWYYSLLSELAPKNMEYVIIPMFDGDQATPTSLSSSSSSSSSSSTTPIISRINDIVNHSWALTSMMTILPPFTDSHTMNEHSGEGSMDRNKGSVCNIKGEWILIERSVYKAKGLEYNVSYNDAMTHDESKGEGRLNGERSLEGSSRDVDNTMNIDRQLTREHPRVKVLEEVCKRISKGDEEGKKEEALGEEGPRERRSEGSSEWGVNDSIVLKKDTDLPLDIYTSLIPIFTHYLSQSTSLPPSLSSTSPSTSSASSTSSSSLLSVSLSRTDVVVIGGTFDHLHSGHLLMLNTAVTLAKKSLVIGLTGDKMLVNKKYKEYMQPYFMRKYHLIALLSLLSPSLEVHIHELSDPYGPSLDVDDHMTLVVSHETASGGEAVNKERHRLSKGSLKIQVIPLTAPLHIQPLPSLPSNSIDKSLSVPVIHKLASTDYRRTEGMISLLQMNEVKQEWNKLIIRLQGDIKAMNDNNTNDANHDNDSRNKRENSSDNKDGSASSSHSTPSTNNPSTSDKTHSETSKIPSEDGVEMIWHKYLVKYNDPPRAYHTIAHLHRLFDVSRALFTTTLPALYTRPSSLPSQPSSTPSSSSAPSTPSTSPSPPLSPPLIMTLTRLVRDTVSLAIIFHDVIYDPTRHDNELLSQSLLDTCAHTLGIHTHPSVDLAKAWIGYTQILDTTLHQSATHFLSLAMLLSTPPPSLPAPPSHPLHVHPSLTPGSSSTSSSSSLSSSSSSSLSWTMSLLNHGLGIFLDSDLEVLTWSPQKYLLYAYQIRCEYAHISLSDYLSGRTKVLTSLLNRPSLYFLKTPLSPLWQSLARKNITKEIASLKEWINDFDQHFNKPKEEPK